MTTLKCHMTLTDSGSGQHCARHTCLQAYDLWLSLLLSVIKNFEKNFITRTLEAITTSKQEVTIQIPKKSTCAYLTVTKALLVSTCPAPEEVGHAFINVCSHVPFAAIFYIPHCIPACN